jgi:hypothetical protein
MNNPMLISVWIIFGLSILTTNISNNFVMAARNAGALVVQEQVSTGNLSLDKEINKFYHCISKTHEDPPTIEKVDNCYYQTSIGDHQTSTGGTSDDDGNRNIQYNNDEPHSSTVGILRVVPPPGVLVEVNQSS